MKCKYLLMSFLALASCTKEVSVIDKELPDLPSEAIREARLNLSIRTGQSSKADGFTGSFEYEDKINNIQILVFDSETGSLNYYEDLGKSMSGSMNLYIGPKTIYALANGPSLEDVSTLEQLEEVTFSMKEYNTASGMIMMVKKDYALDEDLDVTLYLNRLASRIYVKIVNNMLSAAYPNIKVLSAMLGNVSSQISAFGESVDDADAINPYGVLDNPVYGFTYQDVNKNAVVGIPCSVAVPLYCYKNESTDETGTFVSLKIDIDGTPYYYTIYLKPNDLVMNSTSDLILNVIGLGSTDPAEVVEKLNIEYEIEVREWQFASSYTETI